MQFYKLLKNSLICCFFCAAIVAGAQIKSGHPGGNMALAQASNRSLISLTQALQNIQTRFNVSFLFKDNDLDGKKLPVELLDEKDLPTLLSALVKEAGLQVEQTAGNVYTIQLAGNMPISEIINPLLSKTDSAKAINPKGPIKLTGVITDETGQPMPGVTLLIMSSKKGTITGFDGAYSLDVDDQDSLEIRYIGYQTQVIGIAGRATINIPMKPTVNLTGELVVVGYGTQTKNEVTSSISSINAKVIASTPVADAAQAMQGRVAGVQIIQNSGAPGGTGGTSIRIRGISSVTGSNNPLIVLDGFPLSDQTSDNILNAISPNDIESIDVLKDAAAASIYGVRGSNGVVMITTKRGKEGKAKISFDYYRGQQEAWNLPSMLNARDYSIINSESRLASGIPVIDKLSNPDSVQKNYGAGTNWLQQIFRPAAITNYSFNISGGSEKAKYSVSAGYFNQDGIVKGTSFDRYTFRFNGDMNVSKKLKIGNSLVMTRTNEIPKNTYDPFNSLLLLAVASPPTVSPYNADGSFAGGNGATDGFNEPNPLYDIKVPYTTNTRYRSVASVFGEYEIIQGLSARANLGMDFLMQNVRTWSPATPSSGGRPITITGYNDNTSFNPSYLGEFTLNYKKTIREDHHFNALAGYTIQDNNYNSLGAGRSGYVRQDLRVLDDAAVVPANTSQTYNYNSYGTSRLLSVVGRLGYDYKGKYLFSFSLRQDGSSNFAPGHKYATFPSASASWNVSEEKFMNAVPQISSLKVRASIGQTGNQNVSAFAYLQKINTGIQYPFGDNSGPGGANSAAAPTSTKNSNLIWEKNQQSNLGIDFGLWRNRVNVSVDIYDRRSLDLIFNVSPTATSGTYESSPVNTGTMVNQGIDLTLNTVNTGDNSPIKWTSTLIYSTYKNKVTDLGLSAPILSPFTRIVGGGLRVDQGLPVNYFYGYETEGIFQTKEEVKNHAVQTVGTNASNSTAPGDIKFKDQNGDGVINDKDRVNLGNSIPNFTYGFTNTFSYKIFELSVFLQGSSGNKVFNFTRWYTEGGVSNGNFSTAVLDRWTGPGTSNSMPRMIQADPNQNNRVSSRFIEDGSYLRVKNVKFTITLPQSWAKVVTASNLRFYASIQNALTFTKYTGFDPEVGGGVDMGYYPQARTWLGGVTFDF